MRFWPIYLLFLVACKGKSDKNETIPIVKDNVEVMPAIDSIQFMRDSLKHFDLVSIQTLDSTILVDLKYASTDNFMKMKLYEHLQELYLQKDVASRIVACQHYLDSIRPGFRLLLYDGVRPVSVQIKMWKAMDSIPPSIRGKYVSNPKNRSVHNFGAAVDLTIVDSLGNVLDMGAGYDEFDSIAYPSLEGYFLKNGQLSLLQYSNRKLLRQVMRSQKFRNIPSEWWHFNACSRNEAINKYTLLEREPFSK